MVESEKIVFGLFLRPTVVVTASPNVMVHFLTNVYATNDGPSVCKDNIRTRGPASLSGICRSEVSESGISIREVETPLRSSNNCERF